MFNVIYIKNKYTKFSYMAMTFTSQVYIIEST